MPRFSVLLFTCLVAIQCFGGTGVGLAQPFEALTQPPAEPVAPTTVPQSPATSDVSRVVGTWDFNANGYRGTLTISQGANGAEARLNLGRDEGLQDFAFDPATGRVEFFRPAAAQHYVGSVTGNQIEGQFNQGVGSSYVYTWHATMPNAAPSAPTSAKPTSANPSFNSSVTGLWAINGNGFGGQLRLAFGPDGLAGYVRYDALGRDEILYDVLYDATVMQVEFTRVLSSGLAQHYVGNMTPSGNRIEGVFNQGADTQYVYSWTAILLERDGFVPQGETAPTVAPPSGAVTRGLLRTPAAGTAEHSAIIDTARAPIERDIGLPILFVVTTLNTDGTWAYLQGTPVNPDGTAINWSRSNFAREMAIDAISDVAMVLMHNNGTGWRVVDHIFGPTDVYWVGWMQDLRLPEALFYP